MYGIEELFEFRNKLRAVVIEAENVCTNLNLTVQEVATIHSTISLLGLTVDTFFRLKQRKEGQ